MRLPIPLTQKFRSLTPLWQSLSPSRRRQLLGLQILSLAAAAGEVANLGALLPVLRLLANPTEGLQSLGPLATQLGMLPEQHLLLTLGLGFVVVVVFSTALRVATGFVQLRLTALIAADIGDRVFSKVLHKPFQWHLSNNSSNVLSYLTKDVDQVNAIVYALLSAVVNLAIVLVLGGSLVALAPSTMPITFVILTGFYVLVFRFTRGGLRFDGQQVVYNYQASLQVAQEALGGIRDVLLDHSQPFFLDAYRKNNRRYRISQALINVKAQVPRYLIEGFSVVLIIVYALSLALSDKGIGQQLPLLGTLALGAYKLLHPLQLCFSAFSGLQANQESLRRLQPFLVKVFDDSSISFHKQPELPPRSRGKAIVQFQQVSYRYTKESSWVLRDLEISIQPGERIAFVGTTGSGKSTTSDLILGLLEPTHGRLLVHGQDLHATPGMVPAWQRRVAHVPQSIFLSDASFAANIAFGMPEAQIDKPRVRRAAEQAQIAELIETSANGYATMVGERGVCLSGGQRQRIGLARALYKRAELLVLDEATSALDNRTEAEVMAAIEGLDRHVTVILIAHRLSTVQRCDRILLLERGSITGLGTYDQLVKDNVSFQRLAHEPNFLNS